MSSGADEWPWPRRSRVITWYLLARAGMVKTQSVESQVMPWISRKGGSEELPWRV